jgi:hypothetical protein
VGTLLKNGKLELQSTLTFCNDLVGGHIFCFMFYNFLHMGERHASTSFVSCFIISCIGVRGPHDWRASIITPGDVHLPYMLQLLSKIDGSISTENIT